MNYNEFLEYIYQRHSGNVKLGLERMESILRSMGNPNKKLKGIHIAGTNGKGSTAASCEALSIAHGLKTGLNTSPHLIDYRERIRVNKIDIPFEELLHIYKVNEDILESNEASFFEISTALAFYYFMEKKVDNAIFEVGLGGRLDGTNPFQSTVSAITTISLDHTKSLGDTIEKIAYEKAGIIKHKTPVIIGNIVNEAKKVIKIKANEMDAPIIEYGKDFWAENIVTKADGTYFDYVSKIDNGRYNGLKANLLGDYQAVNAALAIQIFSEFCKRTGRDVYEEKVRKGLESVLWQGRMEIAQTSPLVILDGAHNVEGVDSLCRNLQSIFPDEKFIFVLAILRDKHLDKMISQMSKISKKMYISKNGSKRAAEIEEQTCIAEKNNADYATYETVVDALKASLKNASETDKIIVCGSLYTIAEIIKEKDNLFDNHK